MSSRDPWLDNVKMTLVTLVVVGHSWGQLPGADLDLQLYDFLYTFHIPAFVLETGHLSRAFEWDRRHLGVLVTTVVVPYLVFECALLQFREALGQHEDGPMWLQPHWGMWYLCVLFFWRLATPLLRSHWGIVPLSVVVSLAGGVIDELLFNLPRILGLLPFFVIGLHLDRARLEAVRARWPRPLAVTILVAVFVCADRTDQVARSAFLYYDAGYESIGYSAGHGMLIRATVMVVGLLGTLSVLALVPRGASWFSRMGAATLVVYLVHGFVVRSAESAGGFELPLPHALLLVAVTLAAVGVSLGLATQPVAGRLRWAVDPVGSWRRYRPERAEPGVGSATRHAVSAECAGDAARRPAVSGSSR